MTAQDITALLGPATPRHLHLYPTLPSTNTTLREMAEAGAPHGTAVLAEEQTAGRGRLGRQFCSPRGAGLYISLLVKEPLPAEKLPLLTPYAAVAAARAIERVAALTVGIKWVNDLRVCERKIAGILTEGGFSPDGGLAYAVVGIGIDILPAFLPPHLDGIAAAIGDFTEPPRREVLAAALLDAFFGELSTLRDGSFMEEYRRRSVVLGRCVTAYDADRTLTGRAVAILDDGALQIETDTGTACLRAGEVSLKL